MRKKCWDIAKAKMVGKVRYATPSVSKLTAPSEMEPDFTLSVLRTALPKGEQEKTLASPFESGGYPLDKGNVCEADKGFWASFASRTGAKTRQTQKNATTLFHQKKGCRIKVLF